MTKNWIETIKQDILPKCKTALVIGAMDGITWDEFIPVLPKYPNLERVVLVEPTPWHFQTLMKNYAMYDNFEFENGAVGSESCAAEMIAIGPYNYDKVPAWAVGAAVLGKDYITKEGNTNLIIGSPAEIAAIKKYSEIIRVNTWCVSDLLRRYSLKQVDFLQIDAEGHDWTILQQFDLDAVRPMAIVFECMHLSEQTLKTVAKWFEDHNYDYYERGISSADSCAFRRVI